MDRIVHSTQIFVPFELYSMRCMLSRFKCLAYVNDSLTASGLALYWKILSLWIVWKPAENDLKLKTNACKFHVLLKIYRICLENLHFAVHELFCTRIHWIQSKSISKQPKLHFPPFKMFQNIYVKHEIGKTHAANHHVAIFTSISLSLSSNIWTHKEVNLYLWSIWRRFLLLADR